MGNLTHRRPKMGKGKTPMTSSNSCPFEQHNQLTQKHITI